MAVTAGAAVCDEKARLIRENDKAVDEYVPATLRQLERERATTSTLDYEKLAQAVEEARRFAARARRTLEHHISDHGC
jgi:hypothetical protein